MSFFDAPWHIVLLLLAALILFGSSRLPGAARALGSSMNIFKKAVKGEEDRQVDASNTGQQAHTPPAQLTSGPATSGPVTSGPTAQSQQTQIDELQRQLHEVRQQAAAGDRPGTAQTSADSRPQSY
jgi:sec-independent protein translocase protein TatA